MSRTLREIQGFGARWRERSPKVQGIATGKENKRDWENWKIGNYGISSAKEKKTSIGALNPKEAKRGKTQRID